MPELRPFQREDVDFIKAHGLRVLMASAPGVGKTVISIVALAETHRTSLPAVVVCPASVSLNWVREFKKWTPGLDIVHIGDGSSPIPKPTPATVYILSWALLDTRWMGLKRRGIKTVVADEAHYGRSPDALRSKAIRSLCECVPHVLLNTGTPIVNTPSELAILQDLLGSTNPPMIRRLLEDVAPDIPPKTRAYIRMQLRPKHQAIYNQANDDFETWLRAEKEKLLGSGLAEIEVERALAAEALAKVGYLRRLLGEFKVPAASDWIARAVRIGEPVVVFLEHQGTLKKLSRALKKQRIRHLILEGSTSVKERQKAIDAFQRYKYPVFIGTRAAQEGITLTAARHALFLERYFTSAAEEQAEDRIRRISQLKATTIWYLQAEGTIDDRIDFIVRTKRRVIRTAIGSADTAETDATNVAAMLSSWEKGAVGNGAEGTAEGKKDTAEGKKDTAEGEKNNPLLGLGEPMEPLPSPSETHAVVFKEGRWKPLAALRWCRMNGYNPEKRVVLKDRFKMVVHPAPVFEAHAFSVFQVSEDIKIIKGKRLSRNNERRIRRILAGERPEEPTKS